MIIELALSGKQGNCCPLHHIEIKTFEQSPSKRHSFSEPSLTPKRIGFVTLMVGSLIFILATAFLAGRDKILTRKWLWVIFILFGTWGATMNWTTGNIDPNFYEMKDGVFNFSFIKFNLLGSGFERAGVFQPWILEWGFPLGAVIYWLTKKRRAAKIPENFS